MLFHIIAYLFAVIGLVNSIHYPVKFLLAARNKTPKITSPVNIIGGILLPDPNENWIYVPQCNTKGAYWKLDNMEVATYTIAGVSKTNILVGDFRFAYESINKGHHAYRDAIANAYTERNTIRLLES